MDCPTDGSEQIAKALARERHAILKAELEQDALSALNTKDTPEHRKLQRELRQEALTRLEEAARTEADFHTVIQWWDKLDANRERRERYHEISRSGDDIPLDYGAVRDGASFPAHMGGVLESQIRKGDFIDAIYYCPFELSAFASNESLYHVLEDLSAEQKELLFLWAIQRLNTAQIGAIRNQSDRNIRKVRNTMLRHIWKDLWTLLEERARKGLPLTREERLFLEDTKKAALDISKDSE